MFLITKEKLPSIFLREYFPSVITSDFLSVSNKGDASFLTKVTHVTEKHTVSLLRVLSLTQSSCETELITKHITLVSPFSFFLFFPLFCPLLCVLEI